MRSTKLWPYIISFAITTTIFATALWISNFVSEKRIEEIQSIESRIAIDILSLETQFDLLENLSCENLKENSVLSEELRSLGTRLTFAENELGALNPEVLRLKRQYSLLQIKDYLLMQRVTEKCRNIKPVFILYFYSNLGDCPDCEREGAVLSYLEEKYPELRVYAFDYNLDLGALKTLIAVSNIKKELPVLVIDGKAYYGFRDRLDVEKILPTEKLKIATTTPDKSTDN